MVFKAVFFCNESGLDDSGFRALILGAFTLIHDCITTLGPKMKCVLYMAITWEVDSTKINFMALLQKF